MILENDGTKARPVRVFESVLGIVDRGRDHLRVWEATRGIIESDTWLADLAMPFFVLTAIAHVEAAAMYAAKLADTYGDSVNVGYLLNIIEADKKQALRSNEWPRVEGPVAAARNRLGEISENTRRIKEKRDHDLAHLDRRHLRIAFESQAIEGRRFAQGL